MDAENLCAVIAVLSGNDISTLSSMLKSLGYSCSGIVSDGISAIETSKSVLPDLLLADAVLPGIDGFMLARRLYSMPLNVYPAIILAKLPGTIIPDSMLKLSGVAVIDKPFSVEALAKALSTVAPEKRSLSSEKLMHLEALLDDLGVPDHPGRSCLIHGISLAWADNRRIHALRKKLYPAVAEKSGLTLSQAERAIRYVIDYAWRNGEIEKQHKIFGDTIDARRGKPTCGEMIARLADILRWEGKT